MAAESHYFVADSMLEPHHNAYRDDHDGKSDGDPNGSYTNSRTAHLAVVAIIGVDPMGKEKGKFIILGLSQDMPPVPFAVQ